MSEYRVHAEDHGAVRLVTLDRPDKLNAFTAAGYRALMGRLDDAATDPAVSACVLTGAGRAFTAGVDLNEMERPNGSAELGAGFDPLMRALAEFPKPLLAAVNGVAVGFGATILLHCDIVIVDERARIMMPFVSLGTCAEAASSWLLPQRVGLQRASWMVLSGEPLDAAQAVAWGFALDTAPPGRVVEATLARADKLASQPLAALIANKRLLRHGRADVIADTWEREKAAMMAIAETLGSIGWDRR